MNKPNKTVACPKCIYEDLSLTQTPCNTCEGFTNFKPKRKSELLELLEEKERDIKNLHDQIDNLEKYAKYDESASELKAMYDSFVNVGFSEQQAFILLTTAMDSTLRK